MGLTKNNVIIALIVTVAILGITLWGFSEHSKRLVAEKRITELEYAKPETIWVSKTISIPAKPQIVLKPIIVSDPALLTTIHSLNFEKDSLEVLYASSLQTRFYKKLDSSQAVSEFGSDTLRLKYMIEIIDERLRDSLYHLIIFDPVELKSKQLIPSPVLLKEDIAWYDNFEVGVAASVLLGVLGYLIIHIL
jgi:hypothetical protein